MQIFIYIEETITCIWEACKSIVIMWSAPDTESIFATSFAEIGALLCKKKKKRHITWSQSINILLIILWIFDIEFKNKITEEKCCKTKMFHNRFHFYGHPNLSCWNLAHIHGTNDNLTLYCCQGHHTEGRRGLGYTNFLGSEGYTLLGCPNHKLNQKCK